MNYRYVLVGLCAVSCLNGMMQRGRSPVHSYDDGKTLICYWMDCEGVSLDKVSSEAKRLYIFMKKCVRDNPTLLNLTPQEFVYKNLESVYEMLHEKELEKELKATRANKKFLIEESARTIEGILNYLVDIRKTR